MKSNKAECKKQRKNNFRKDKLRLETSETSSKAYDSNKYVEYFIEYCICTLVFETDNDLFRDIVLDLEGKTCTKYYENKIELISSTYIEYNKNVKEFLDNRIFLNEEFWFKHFNNWFDFKQSHPSKQIKLTFAIFKLDSKNQINSQVDECIAFELSDFNKLIPDLRNYEHSNDLANRISKRITASLRFAHENVVDLFAHFRDNICFCQENIVVDFYQTRNVEKLTSKLANSVKTLDAKSIYSLFKFKLKEAFAHKKENVSIKESLNQINNELIENDRVVSFAKQLTQTEAILENFNTLFENSSIVIKRKSLCAKLNKEFSKFLISKHLFFLVYGPKSSGKLFTTLNMLNERVNALSLIPGQFLLFNSTNIKCLFDLLSVSSIELFVITEIESIFNLLSKQELNMLMKMIKNSKRKFMLITSSQMQKKLIQNSYGFKVDWLTANEINACFNEHNRVTFSLEFDRRVFSLSEMNSDLYAVLKKPKYLCEILSQKLTSQTQTLGQNEDNIKFEFIKQVPLYSLSSILFDPIPICCLLDCAMFPIEKVKHVMQTLDTFKAIELSSFLSKLSNYDNVIMKQPTLILVGENETEILNEYVLKKLNVQSKVVFVGNGISNKMDFFPYKFNVQHVHLETDLIVQSVTRLNNVVPISYDDPCRLNKIDVLENLSKIHLPLVIERKCELNKSLIERINAQYFNRPFDDRFFILCALETSQLLNDNVSYINLNGLVLAHYEKRNGKLNEWQTELLNKCLRDQSLILVLNDFDVNSIMNNRTLDLILEYPKLILITEQASKTYLRKMQNHDLVKLELKCVETNSLVTFDNENSFLLKRHQLFYCCSTELSSVMKNDPMWAEWIKQYTVYDALILAKLSSSSTLSPQNIINSDLFEKFRTEIERVQFISFSISILNKNKFNEDLADSFLSLNIVKKKINKANEEVLEFENQALQDYFCSLFVVNEMNKGASSKWSSEIKDFLEKKRHYKKFHSVIFLIAELLSFQKCPMINYTNKLDDSLRTFWTCLLKKTNSELILTAHQDLVINCLRSSNLNNEFFKNVQQDMFTITSKSEPICDEEENDTEKTSLDGVIKSIENFLFDHGYQRAPVHLNTLKLLINQMTSLINETISSEERERCFEFLKTLIESNEPTRLILKSHLIEELLINVLVKLRFGNNCLDPISQLLRKHFLNSYQMRTQFKAVIALIKLDCSIDRTMFAIIFETVKRKNSLTNESHEALEYLKKGRIDRNDPQLLQTISTCLQSEQNWELVRVLLKLMENNLDKIDLSQMPEICHAYYYLLTFEQGNANTFNVKLLLDHILNLKLYDLVDHVPSLLKLIECDSELLSKCLNFIIACQSDTKEFVLIEQMYKMQLINEIYFKNYLIDSFLNRTQTVQLMSLCLKYNLINQQTLAIYKSSIAQRVYSNVNLDIKWLLNEFLPSLSMLRDFLVDDELAEPLKYLIRNFLQNSLILNGVKNCLIKMAQYGFNAINQNENSEPTSYEQFLNILCVILNQSVKLQNGSSFKKNFLMKRVSEDLLEFMNNVLCLLDAKSLIACLFKLYNKALSKNYTETANDETNKQFSPSLNRSCNESKFYLKLLICKCKLDSIAIVVDYEQKSEIQFVQNDLVYVHYIQHDWIFDNLISKLACIDNELNVNKNLKNFKLNEDFYLDLE